MSMEIAPQPVSRRVELETRIKDLEEEKMYLQQEVSRMKEQLATVALEKKAKVLENEVTQLKTVKGRLQEQMAQQSKPVVTKPVQSAETAKPTQNASSSQNSPVRYGTWSKLPLP
jgi:peptidoglycan hydrolase CwlO-like protein